MKTTERMYNKNIARFAWGKMKDKANLGVLKLEKVLSTRIVNSGGWAVKIGNFRGYKCTAEIWLDYFTAYNKRKIYYCVCASKPEGIKRLVNLVKNDLGKHISVYHSDWLNDSDFPKLAKPLKKNQFGKPIYERYPNSNEYFYGIYEYEKLGLQRNETKRIILRIIDFFETINTALSKEQRQQHEEIYEAIENRKAVQIHLQRERNGHLSTMRKQKDNYICKLCGFDFYKFYGDLGDDFSEAHHIIPLNKNNQPQISTIDDLITVCSNCHRILHKMKGNKNDIKILKLIIRRRR